MQKIKTIAIAVAVGAALSLSSGLAADAAWAADAKKGEKMFKKCKACHTLKGKNRVGPTLGGLIGRNAATAKGYKYSKDFKAAGEKGLIWNEETLSGYLNKKPGPKKWLGEFLGKKKAKTKMSFSGIKKDEDVANLIEYLKHATK